MKKPFFTKRVQDNLFVYSLVAYPLILFFIFYVVVNFNSVLLAFQRIDGTGKHFAGFDNFKNFWKEMTSNGDLLKYSFINSILMYLVNFAITTPFTFLFSYVLFKKCWGHRTIALVGMIPNMMSGLVVSLVVVQIIGENGPLNYLAQELGWFGGKKPNLLSKDNGFMFTTLYSIWLSFAMSFIMLPTSMRAINSEIFDSAKIDGVTNMFQEICYIIFPLIYPTLTTFWITGVAAIFSSAGCLMEFYDTKAPYEVYNMGYYFTRMVLTDNHELNYPKYAAGGLILTAIIAPITFFVKWALEKFGPSEE